MRLGSTLICWFVRNTSSHHRPWQIAMAITLGVLLGLLPKLTLLFALVGFLCYFTPTHLPLLAIMAGAISCATPLLEASVGRLGLWSLTHPQLSAYWLRLDNLPLVPWLGIHNTVVHGSLMLWLAATIPIYVSCLLAIKVLMMDEISGEVVDIIHARETSQPRFKDADQTQEVRPLSGRREAGMALPSLAPPVVIWHDIDYPKRSDWNSPMEQPYFMSEVDDNELASQAEPPSTDSILRRAAEMAAWAEELIAEELLMDSRIGLGGEIAAQEVASDTASVSASRETQSAADAEDRWLIETTMEVVRIAEQAVTNQAAMKKHTSDPHEAALDSDLAENSDLRTAKPSGDSVVRFPQIPSFADSQIIADRDKEESKYSESTIRREQTSHHDHRSHLDTTRAGVVNGTPTGAVNRPREEALHYLLRHLKGIQEKAQKQ